MERILSLLSGQEFLKTFLDKRCHLSRIDLSSMDFLSHFTKDALFDFAVHDINSTVRSSRDCQPANHGHIDNRAFLEQLYAQGRSLVIQGIQDHPHLAPLVSRLEEFLKTEISINAYISPESCQGFPRHWDTHDVIVLQTSGAKNWWLDRNPSFNVLEDEIFHELNPYTKRVLLSKELDLHEFSEGTVAYIPRGTLHEVFTRGDASVHLTIGLQKMANYDRLNHPEGTAGLAWSVPLESPLRQSHLFSRDSDKLDAELSELNMRIRKETNIAVLNRANIKTIYSRDGYTSVQTHEKVIHLSQKKWLGFLKNPHAVEHKTIAEVLRRNGIIHAPA